MSRYIRRREKPIKIPVAGGKSYSPDFAFVLEFKDGKKRINFIVEIKNKIVDLIRELVNR